MTYECCNKQQIFNSDYKKYGELIENKHCTNCKIHWHDNVKYTRQEWDNHLNSGWDFRLPTTKLINILNTFDVPCLLEVPIND